MHELTPTIITLRLADRSIKYPWGIAEGVLVKVGTFIIPVYFIVLDMEEDKNMPLIQRRPFLATSRALIDVQKASSNIKKPSENKGQHPDRMKKRRNQASRNIQGTHVRKKQFKDVDKRYHEYNGLTKVDWKRIKHYLEGTLPPPVESPLLLS
ncbi:UNVERIFIED_CONTAM: hypothetical protein Scaly_0081600 [Sesamum calycinum]|uniref:Reverse transcriptase domain-containing protein n=1 Tax=Sesamum calycinum TaxID=2727403 RepID=A0AAW2SVD8_9LAMI